MNCLTLQKCIIHPGSFNDLSDKDNFVFVVSNMVKPSSKIPRSTQPRGPLDIWARYLHYRQNVAPILRSSFINMLSYHQHGIVCVKTMANHLSAPHTPLTHLHSRVILWSYSWDVKLPFDMCELWLSWPLITSHLSIETVQFNCGKCFQRQEIFGS